MFSVNCFKATGSGHEEAATSAPAWPQKNLFRGKIKHALSFAFFFCWIEDSFLIFFVCFLLFQITTGPGRVVESAEGAQGAPKDEEPKKKEEKILSEAVSLFGYGARTGISRKPTGA